MLGYVMLCFISHVTTSETEIKLFQWLKLFQNYFSDIEHARKILTSCSKLLA